MLTEQEFYKRKIFLKEGITELRKLYKEQINEIKLWYRSDKYLEIQNLKSKLESKLEIVSVE